MNNIEKKIAIRGHKDRGAEVIKALEDLGGLNYFYLQGIDKGTYYYIDDRGYIVNRPINNNLLKDFLTLEEYLNTKNNMENNRNITISLETAKEWYKGNNSALKELALQAFKEHELQDISCVKSWNEFCKQYNKLEHEYFIDLYSDIKRTDKYCKNAKEDRNLLATKEDAEAVLALIQLKRLRDQWWEVLDWKPDYPNTISAKYNITLNMNIITIERIYTISRFLVFPTEEIAKEFLSCFKDLIEKAKELI